MKPGAGPGAEPEFVAQARRLARRAEQVALAGEDDRHGRGAVTQPEQVVQRAHRLDGPAERGERPVAAKVVCRDRAAGRDPGARTPGDLDENRAAGAVEPVVEMRAELADLPQLREVGGEFARHVVPADVVCRVQDAGGLVLRVSRPEVGQEPRAEPLGLPDVQHPASVVHHPVDAGPILGQRAHAVPQLSQIGGRERQQPRARALQAWHRWQKTVIRPSMSCVPVSRVPQFTQRSPSRPYTCRAN